MRSERKRKFGHGSSSTNYMFFSTHTSFRLLFLLCSFRRLLCLLPREKQTGQSKVPQVSRRPPQLYFTLPYPLASSSTWYLGCVLQIPVCTNGYGCGYGYLILIPPLSTYEAARPEQLGPFSQVTPVPLPLPVHWYPTLLETSTSLRIILRTLGTYKYVFVRPFQFDHVPSFLAD